MKDELTKPTQVYGSDDGYVYFSGVPQIADWDIDDSTYPLIMCKHQPDPNKIRLDMRYKVNKEFVKNQEEGWDHSPTLPHR